MVVACLAEPTRSNIAGGKVHDSDAKRHRLQGTASIAVELFVADGKHTVEIDGNVQNKMMRQDNASFPLHDHNRRSGIITLMESVSATSTQSPRKRSSIPYSRPKLEGRDGPGFSV